MSTEPFVRSTERTYELDRRHVFHSWSAQAELDPMVITAAQGSYIWTGDGDRLLDFTSQLVNVNIGHQHPDVVAAIAEQARELATVAPQHANELAVRMARLVTGRPKVLTRYRSYHGGTELAVNLTGDPRRWPNDSATAGTVHFHGPYLYRSPFYATTEEQECLRGLEHLESVIQLEGQDTVGAILLETIPGTAGIMPPPPGYLAGVRALCDRYGIVLILDEVMSGFGRSGSWFAADDENVVPDLLTFAKGVNSGYVPLGGVAIGDAIADHFAHRPYPGGLTYSGHPLACAAAVGALTAMARDKIVDNAHHIGHHVIGPELEAMAQRHACVGEARGRGVFWALELVADQDKRTPLTPAGGYGSLMREATRIAKAQGLLMLTSGNRIHIVPPCTITETEARDGLRVIDNVLDHVDAAITAG